MMFQKIAKIERMRHNWAKNAKICVVRLRSVFETLVVYMQVT